MKNPWSNFEFDPGIEKKNLDDIEMETFNSSNCETALMAKNDEEINIEIMMTACS